jgi:hypothetical protein
MSELEFASEVQPFYIRNPPPSLSLVIILCLPKPFKHIFPPYFKPSFFLLHTFHIVLHLLLNGLDLDFIRLFIFDLDEFFFHRLRDDCFVQSQVDFFFRRNKIDYIGAEQGRPIPPALYVRTERDLS